MNSIQVFKVYRDYVYILKNEGKSLIQLIE